MAAAMIFDRWILLSLISAQLARLLAMPHSVTESLVLVASVRLYVTFRPL
jgi:hypothetical protein